MEYCNIGDGKKVHIIEYLGGGYYKTWALCGLSEWEPVTVRTVPDDTLLCKNCLRIQAKDRRL